ncbi:similar to BCAS2 family protein [Plenodomus lingam JN3]|uniref:Similar to BCAS2 family protein n=1 Tax=Leptosphaeria maculans (strain JN3 / isolate v23.1.3 / race Av1-4-5-6-7-8) TaxID=985895 RepID=E5ADL9_LEPMJ|nr:similar to BCAS2 family protein [Plenodomus lingam JN3]CBY01308.1 similar to BCAS2 family protein [Plenodomus lingam JN3]
MTIFLSYHEIHRQQIPCANLAPSLLADIDTLLDDQSLAAAQSVIAAEIRSAGIDTSELHPALIPAAKYTPTFSDFVEREHARLDDDPSSKMSGIDLKRYEDLDAPDNTTPTTDQDRPELLEQWNKALKQAYTSSEYVQGRLTQLGLLEKFGKNAWLVGNSQLEDVLKGIEAELAQVREWQEQVEAYRRSQQEAVLGEIKTLEETWKKGVGRVLETEVAAEALKQQILDKRRAGAV